MSAIDRYLSAADREKVREAVREAEGRTAGEIVPYVVEASDSYEASLWKGASFGALAAGLFVGLAQQIFDFWIDPALPPIVRWSLPVLLGAAAGYLAASVSPSLRRALIPAGVVERRVRRRAAVAFLEEEVFKTRERTGILIFLSLFERRVVVLGDEGINRRVAEAEWVEVVDRLTDGIRRRQAGDALVAAIAKCGELLERRGIEVRPDDEDELSNELRSRER